MFYCLKNKMLCEEDYLKHIARGRNKHSFQWRNSFLLRINLILGTEFRSLREKWKFLWYLIL